MSLYDVLGDITEGNEKKTDGGESKITGAAVGIVAKKYSKDMPGRVCVQIPVRDKDANVLKWAKVAMFSAGTKWGGYFLPEIGDKVLLMFEGGNIEKPYIIGSIFPENSTFLSDTADENNQYKKITTKNGNTIFFEDNSEGEGSKDKIKIETSKEERTILLDNENKKISINDKKKENAIEIDSENGIITVKSGKELKINVGNVSVKIDGENGTIDIKCQKLSVKAEQGIKMETNGMLKIKSENGSISGNSSMKVSSDGTTVIGGAMIKEG